MRPTSIHRLPLASATARLWWRAPARGHLLWIAVLLAASAIGARAIEHATPWMTAMLALLLSAILVRPGVRSASILFASGWPAVLPIAPVTRRITARAPLVLAATLAGLFVAGAVATAWPFEVALAIAAGGFSGAVAAAVWPIPSDATAYPASRYRRSKPGGAGPALQAVVDDLHALVAERMQPRVLARTVVPLLLLAPAGLGMLEAVVFVAALAALVYAGFLFAAFPVFVVSTRRWLAATPIPFGDLIGRLRNSVRIRLLGVGLALAPMVINASAPGRAILIVVGLLLAADRLAAHRLGHIRRCT